MTNLPNLTPHAGDSPVDDSSSTPNILVLDNKMRIYRVVLEAVEARIPTLVDGKAYSLRKMAGPKVWGMLDRHEKIWNGKTFAYLVSIGEFDLEFACHPERSNKTYRRK